MAEALANIRDVDIKKFVWRNIVTTFGVPESLVYDNRLQFDSKAFQKFCSNLDIKNKYSTLACPQSNGKVKVTNKAIVTGLKKRLEGMKGMWAEELPNVLWAYWTTPKRSTRETPFSLTYRGKVMIPTEVRLCRAWVSRFVPCKNKELMVKQLDLLQEHRESATIKLAEYQQKLAC